MATRKREANPTPEQRQQRAYVQFFRATCVAEGLPLPVAEYRFDDGTGRPRGNKPPRRWLFDLAFPEYKVAVEVEGGAFMRDGKGGRHNSGVGFLDDMEKYNEATAQGWRVLRCTPSLIRYTKTGRQKTAPYLFGGVFISSLRRALVHAGFVPANRV